MKVEDLDILRPQAKFIKIGGKDIDVSFIPCAITSDIDDLMEQLQKVSISDLIEDKDKEKDLTDTQKLELKNIRKKNIKEAFNISIKLCATFCEHKYPELDEEWFMNNTDAGQIQLFTASIKDALSRAYSGIRTDEKNLKAAKKQNH